MVNVNEDKVSAEGISEKIEECTLTDQGSQKLFTLESILCEQFT